jgi:pyruvate,water dikinase
MQDIDQVGGKNASLGEMISHLSGLGVDVPGGFATTSFAFQEFLSQSGLAEKIDSELSSLDVDDVNALATSGARIRQWVMDTPFQASLNNAVSDAWKKLTDMAGAEPAVAVRSSATAEDLPDASFAGQQETFLNVRGLPQVLERMHEVFASLYNDRAIAYRVHQSFEHSGVSLSAGVQIMVRSDLASSGVMFTLDTESGFDQVVFITSSWGLGEMVVQGAVNPDEFYVYKPALTAGKQAVLRRNRGSKAIKMIYGPQSDSGNCAGVQTVDVPEKDQFRFSLDDAELESLARQAVVIEEHYGRPMVGQGW